MELDLPPHREGSFDGTLQITATLSTSACLPTDEAPVLPSLAPVCRNDKCASSSSSSSSPSPSWKHGWLLRSGRIADLCEPCGLAYERNCFCETFHADETGWRACISCQKQVHCGCIASMLLYVLLDTGGIECVDCANKKSCASSLRMDDPSSGGWTQDKKEKLSWTSGSGPPSLITTEQGRLTHGQILSEGQYHCKTNHVADDGILGFIPAVYCAKEEDDANAMVLNKIKLEESAFPVQDASSFLLQGQRECQGVIEKDTFLSENVKHLMDFEATKEGCLQQNAVNGAANSIGGMSWQVKNRQALESLCGSKGMGTVKLEPSLSLGPLGSSKQVANEACETGSTKTLLTQKFSGSSPAIQRPKQRMPKPPQAQTCAHTETPNDSLQGLGRVARPPGEGRGKNQLLPRYWPRITDQELQQISSGDSNSIITPLFEKMLSASDAGRIGRLVLPKACAEAYFPTISQAEGIPLKIQDVNGREWLFQFRFWPNNNSRMYVLEGVTPCIQSMQLQAGDIVTFSRLDPEGKLIMGCRQAPTSQSSQDPQNSNTRTLSAPTSLTPEKQSQKLKEECFPQTVVCADRKKRRTLCSKTKRLRLEVGEPSVDWDNLMWEEVQLLLQPPPKVVPTIVTIEGHDFEEYEEPPVFGTGYFSPPREGRPREEQCVHSEDCESGQNHQDNTPLQTKWTCGDSSWDSKRDTSGTPMEVENGESDSKLLLTKDAPSGLEALANAAVMGENRASSSCPAPTTKHPRHRPGCTCIVCIQPPSGKGPKHKTTCICNVCMTVKRRFTTLMMRRKKRQSEQEAESARKKLVTCKEEGETNDGIELHNETNFMPEKRLIKGSLGIAISGGLTKINHLSSNGGRLSSSAAFASLHQLHHKPVVQKCVFEKAPIDLNSQPERDDEAHKDLGRVSMMMLFRSANYPLERYLQQQGIPDLSCLNQITSQTIPYPENQGELILEKNCSQSVALTSDRRENQSFDLTRKTFDNGEVGDQDLEKQGKSCVLKL